jgi:putative DNA-invertase from lambdoid prophage Rac
VTASLREFMRRGVIIRTVINSMVFDGATTDPIQKAVRDALIAFMAATAQAQAEATKAAQKAGIELARGKGDKYLVRKPSFTKEAFEAVIALDAQGKGVSEIAALTSLSRQTIYRIKADPAAANRALANWNNVQGA